MRKILISVPDQLAARLRAAVPPRKRSSTIARLIEREVSQREQQLYNAAVAVEKDDALHHEMEDWNITLNDGLEDD